MRFLFVSTLYPNAVQPTRSLYNHRVMSALVALGHCVEVIAPVPVFPGRPQPPPPVEVIDSITVHHPRFVAVAKVFRESHPWFYRKAIQPVFQRLTSETADLRVIIGFAYPDGVAASPLCIQAQCDWRLLVLGSDVRLRTGLANAGKAPLAYDTPVRKVLHQAPGILCPGLALKSDVEKLGVPPERITSFNNGIDPNLFYPLKASEAGAVEKNFLFVGNFFPVKCPERAVMAFAQSALPAQGYRLTLIGDGPLRERLESLAKSSGASASIHFTGRQPPASVADAMRRATALILPSVSEGMPNVVVEALGCGCPVVATPVGEVPNLLRKGENGFVLPEGLSETDLIQTLTQSLEAAASTPWNRSAIAEATSQFRWPVAAEKFVAAFS